MTLIVKTITRLILGFIIVFAVSIVFYGHITPGGGFAGGVMLACVFILLVLAFGKDTAFRIVGEKALSAWDCIGALGFMGIALFSPGGFMQTIGLVGLSLNAWIALFNMIPFGQFDGAKIWSWSKLAYFAIIAASLVLTIVGNGIGAGV